MSKHTPGPWSWSSKYRSSDDSDTWSLIGADGYGILSCDGMANSPQECHKADAPLIAAAPELLEALKRVRDSYVGGYSAEVRASCWQQAQAAIAKAEGAQ